MQAFGANAYRGKRLRMTAFVKTSNVQSKKTDGGAFLSLDISSEKTLGLARDCMETRQIKGTTEWKQYAVVLDVPQEADIITFGCWLNGTGRAWVDDFHFEVVGNDVETTALFSGPG
jgi:hypothetical protein